MEQSMGLVFKISVTISLLLVAMSSSFAQVNSIEKDNLKGNVKKLTTIFYVEDLEDGTGFNEHYTEHIWYNIKGNDSLKVLKQKRDDFKPRKTIYLYNSKDNIDSVIVSDVDENTTSIYSYQYDSLNRVVKEREFIFKNESYIDTHYDYNAEGEIIKERINMDNSDELLYALNYKYTNGNVVEMSNSFGTSASTFKYNEFNDRVFYESSVGVTLFEYEYDSFNNWIKRTDWILNNGTKDTHPSIVRTIEYR